MERGPFWALLLLGPSSMLKCSRELVCTTDYMRTCADILDMKLPDTAAEDSISLQPLLLGGNRGVRQDVINHALDGSFAFRKGKWKLCLSPCSGGWHPPAAKKLGKEAMREMPQIPLFDLDADIGEKEQCSRPISGGCRAIDSSA